MLSRRIILHTVVCLYMGVLAARGAEDAFYFNELHELKITQGQWADGENVLDWNITRRLQNLISYAQLDGAGEAYIVRAANSDSPFLISRGHHQTIAIRAPAGSDVSGRIFVPNEDCTALFELKFAIKQSELNGGARKKFFANKAGFFRMLAGRELPGSAWFRHQAMEAEKAGGLSAPDLRNRPNWQPRDEVQEAFALFTGGRALSENMQLDRPLLATKPGDENVEIDSLKGITVQEMEFRPLFDKWPQLDPLAAAIPFDQHALFFPSFQAMLDLTDEGELTGTPILQLLEPRAEDAGTRDRYRRQLCLEPGDLTRLLGPRLIKSVAFTGSDPYLRSGSDVAVIFEAANEGVLSALITAKHVAVVKSEPGAKAVKDDLDGTAYSGVVTPDRKICSYLASHNGMVVVSNSLYQLGCVLATLKHKTRSLESLSEYGFFRTRYTFGDKEESALLILSDATIRRWCGARWRIGNLRRTQAAAEMSEQQARRIADSNAAVEQRPGLGATGRTESGISSSIYNTLEFMTPIAELALTKATQAEAREYERWRENYQRNWRQNFDPVALRMGISPAQLSADLTVMPLIDNTQYRTFFDIVKGAKIAPAASARNSGALLQYFMAINKDWEVFKFLGDKANPDKWIGETFTMYLEDDPLWAELANADNLEKFLETNAQRVPWGMNVASRDEAVLKKFVELIKEEAGRVTKLDWTQLEHNGQEYTKITNHLNVPGPRDVFHAIMKDALLFSINEPTLKRALDRRANPTAETQPPILGDHIALQVTRKGFEVFSRATRTNYQERLQTLAWGNIPILNEWKRLFPDQDPVTVHEKLWHIELLCPGGGKYVWNEQRKTMESTVYGSPLDPKNVSAAELPPALSRLQTGNFGITFENQGLRARTVITREAK